MQISSMKLRMHIYECSSLKEKRMVLRSVMTKLKNTYNISISEVEDNDIWNLATIGICIVSNDSKVIESTFTKVLNDLDKRHEFEVSDISREDWDDEK